MTLRWRISLILAGLALAVSAFAAVFAYLATSAQLRSGIDDTLTSRAAAANASLPGRDGHGPDGGRPGGPDADGCPTTSVFLPASAAQLVAADGTVTSCLTGGPRLPVTAADRTLGVGAVSLRTITVGGQEYRLLSTAWREGGTLQIARSLSESNAVLSRLKLRLLLLLALAAVVPALLGWFVATRLSRPIMRLRDAAEHIATTLDLSAPVETRQSGEVGSLAASFRTMVGALARSREQQRRLVSDASHEMRTPLTSLRSNVELLRRIEQLPRPERQEVVDDVLMDIDELSDLLAELVELASDAASDAEYEPVALAELARSAAARAERRSQRDIIVIEHARGDVLGNARQLERAIGNLIDNAVKYSPPGTPVDITVDGPVLAVNDRGRGIAAADRERIFDRFYRAVEVRGEPGSGLGLAIVDEIVRRHGGAVFVADRGGGGAVVGFTLPSWTA